MKITDLLKKVSLVAAVSAVALPAYASDHELEVDIEEVGPKVVVIATKNAGPFTFNVVDTTTGEGIDKRTRRKLTMTNGVVEQVVVNEGGFIGKYSFFLKGDGEAGSSHGFFNLGGTSFNLSAVITEGTDLSDVVEDQVTPFLDHLADTKEHALEAAKQKALALKERFEEEEALRLEEEKALALKLKQEEEARQLEEQRLLEAKKLEEARQLEEARKEEEELLRLETLRLAEERRKELNEQLEKKEGDEL